MQQLVLGFFLGVYVGTKYDLTGYVSAAEEYASKALKDMEKRKRYRYPSYEIAPVPTVPTVSTEATEAAGGRGANAKAWWPWR